MGGKCCCNVEPGDGQIQLTRKKKNERIQRNKNETGKGKDKKQKTKSKAQITFENEAIEYHHMPIPGKYTVAPIKKLSNRHDLAMTHTPGVVGPCSEIAKNPDVAFMYTNKARTIGLFSNGTSVLGLGNLGALASKPDLEGKAALYKRFSGVDCVDVCVDTPDSDTFVNVVKVMSPSFGAINLENIKAPDCFEIEAKLKELMPIPVFHNDQHGTAVVVLAALVNALEIKGKTIDSVKIVCNGAGAAGIATMDLLIQAGASQHNCFLCDTKGVIYKDRPVGMNPQKEALANPIIGSDMTFEEVANGADVLIGFSVEGAFNLEVMRNLNIDPIIFALSNPDPEINPARAKQLRPDAIIATSSPEFDNQINNVMVFPYIMRAVLDTLSTEVNIEMKLEAAQEIANLAKEPIPDSIKDIYNWKQMNFGPYYILPTPFDPRLLERVACAVARKASKTKVAKNPIKDFDAYSAYLQQITVQEETLNADPEQSESEHTYQPSNTEAASVYG